MEKKLTPEEMLLNAIFNDEDDEVLKGEQK